MRSDVGKTKKYGLLAAILAAAALSLLAASPAAAEAGPQWRIESMSNTTAAPGETIEYFVQITNMGDADMDGTPIELTGQLPAGMTPLSARLDPIGGNGTEAEAFDCTLAAAPSVSCEDSVATPAAIHGGAQASQVLQMTVEVEAAMPAGDALAEFEAKGGGAPAASTVDPIEIAPAPPGYGIDAFDAQVRDAAGDPFTQAAGHPADATVSLDFNTRAEKVAPGDPSAYWPVEPPKDVVADLPAGLIGNPRALQRCSAVQLLFQQLQTLCPSGSQLGTVMVRSDLLPLSPPARGPFPLFNMVPPPGAAARFGFNFSGTAVTLDARLRRDGSYRLAVGGSDISEGISVGGTTTTIWGAPADESHRLERACPGGDFPFLGGPTCASTGAQEPFLRNPTSCPGQAPQWGVHTDSWFHPGALGADSYPELSDPAWHSATVDAHALPGYPSPPAQWGGPAAATGCGEVPVEASLRANPSTPQAETSSGLSIHVEVPNQGLENPGGIASSDIRDVKVALPRGLTINPSQAEGLGACSEAQYESTELSFHPNGRGCPDDSKIGTVEVHTPLLEETLPGSVYVARPYENPSGSLIALYIIVEEPQRGVLVKLPVKVSTDGTSGRITAEVDDIPQIPFSDFDFHFREGARAPLVTPPACGIYTTETEIEGWSDPGHPITSKSGFAIDRGIGGAPCPPDGTPGFKPAFSAGSINNAAGAHTAFDMRIQRRDGEQDMTRFSAVLPPGVLGTLAGVAECPESAIAAAKAHNGPHGGTEEIEHPSCPASSEIGRSTVGAGVGSVLTYVPGKVYLGGPFNGDPLSVIAITPVVAGPFDVGTVVVHEALTLNPRTAEVEVDGAASDPIPHILKGIPAKLRDLRVYVDRPDFILNPTSCDPSSTRATLFGGGGNPFSTADDVPVSLADRFQAASCASLGFKPALQLNLKGGTKRGGHPGLRATYKPRKGDADIKGLVVRLPRSAFLDQAHIKTICTRVQFAAGAGNGAECPKASQYGYIKAWTPLLEEPLEGPVFLRSSNHKLPDLVFALHGLVDIEVDVRIDSQNGGIRASLENSPDAPLSKVFLRMQGAKKSLIINSRNLCGSTNRAALVFEGHNGKVSTAKPEMRAVGCGGAHKGRHKRHRR